jgi:hypothetical protein
MTGSDLSGITTMKNFLGSTFQTKDLGKLRYFLGIEVAWSRTDTYISQRKFTMNLIKNTNMKYKYKYKRLVGKLIYLSLTRPDISYAVGVVRQFMAELRQPHWTTAVQIIRYLKMSPSYRRSATCWCVLVGGNLIYWKSKKQNCL